MQNLLSISRMAVGLGFLTVPSSFSSIFIMPFSPVAAIGCRMAGSRDLILGALLYTCHPPRFRSHGMKVTDQSEQTLRTNKMYHDLDSAQESKVRLALTSGIIVDTLDVLAVLWCYLDGTLPAKATMTLGGGAFSLLGLGIYCWHHMSL